MSRFGYVMATYLAVLAAGGLAFFHPAPRLIWNATASTPTGLYALRPVGQLRTPRVGRCPSAGTRRELPRRWRLPAERRACS